MDFAEFCDRFEEIRGRGFVKSMRRGPTGIGYTLETLLGIDENNIAGPDLDGIELKATRAGSSSLITLFTYDRQAWVMRPLDAIRKYGTADKGTVNAGRLGLYFTMAATCDVPNAAGLTLDVDDDHVFVNHRDGTVVACWAHAALAAKFMAKMPKLILVSASSQFVNSDEYFHFERAMVLSGSSADLFRAQLECGKVTMDLRLHDRGSSARNHGTGFRTAERYLPELFAKRREI